MNSKLDTIFNRRTLILLNIAIFVYAELAIEFVANTGQIHLIAIIFIILGLFRAGSHKHVRDQFLEPLIHYGIFALIVLAASHIVEYVSYEVPVSVMSVNVINLYLSSLLIITLGIEKFLSHIKQSSKIIIPFVYAAIGILFFSTVYFHYYPSVIRFDLASWYLYAYGSITIFTAAFCIWRLIQIKRHVSIMYRFVTYFEVAYILICISAMGYLLEDVLTSFNISAVQVIFVDHFLFYGALSLMFLAYQTLNNLGGLYKDLGEMELTSIGK